ncbi:hypothetical protein GEU84_020285 [Fertoebacter nigrum]|uniref:Uncharacterized protein n=1 Tax=Fertoeibacter niger TaxID=2656921 RepID=A0A8X8H3Q8_9RHOB|nr:PA14 domain-containing protein [Fertoeibacter niger]NUB46735.1 hypothetical protein [Fertoeibacter niger]
MSRLSGFALTLCAVSIGSIVHAQVSAEDLRPGVILDFYRTNNDGQAAGRSIATLIYDGAAEIGYHDVFSLEPALKGFQDRFWLIKMSGLLQIMQDGEQTFVTSISNSSRNDANCGGRFDIDEDRVVDLKEVQLRGAVVNQQYDTTMLAGLYPFRVEYYCNAGSTEEIKFSILHRGPLDRLPTVFSKEQLFYIEK